MTTPAREPMPGQGLLGVVRLIQTDDGRLVAHHVPVATAMIGPIERTLAR